MDTITVTSLDTKPLLTLKEASQYTGIGINKLREMSNEKNCNYVLLLDGKECLKEWLYFASWSSRILSKTVS